MKGNRAVLAAVVGIVLIGVGWWLFSRGGGTTQVDLITQLPTAKLQPVDGAFNIIDATLNGEAHKAIEATPPTRITWKVRIPDDAWLRVLVGMKPETWVAEGDGVLFFVGIADGRSFDILFEQTINPFSQHGDRKWVPVMVDLSAYAGEEVEVIFNTRSSKGTADDRRNDLALWGAPEIISR